MTVTSWQSLSPTASGQPATLPNSSNDHVVGVSCFPSLRQRLRRCGRSPHRSYRRGGDRSNAERGRCEWFKRHRLERDTRTFTRCHRVTFTLPCTLEAQLPGSYTLWTVSLVAVHGGRPIVFLLFPPCTIEAQHSCTPWTVSLVAVHGGRSFVFLLFLLLVLLPPNKCRMP